MESMFFIVCNDCFSCCLIVEYNLVFLVCGDDISEFVGNICVIFICGWGGSW